MISDVGVEKSGRGTWSKDECGTMIGDGESGCGCGCGGHPPDTWTYGMGWDGVKKMDCEIKTWMDRVE